MPKCRWYKSQSKMSTALTGYLKPNKSEEKRENSKDPPPPPPPPRWYQYQVEGKFPHRHNPTVKYIMLQFKIAVFYATI